MGVKGLNMFMKTYNGDCLKPKRLHDCALVIDGPNLAHNLMYKSRDANHAFGGDYDLYAREVDEFFKILLKCNISPVVLFDGGLNENKLETEMNRAEEKIKYALRCNPFNHNVKPPKPLLLYEVFFSVLEKRDIPFMRCEKEADGDAATLAKMLDAPVLSADTDFYICDVQFIPYHSLTLDIFTEGKCHYLKCREFDRVAFSSKFKTALNMLPLFAALVGNDYVNSDQSEKLCSKVPMQHIHSPPHDKLISVLAWLQNQGDIEIAVKKLLKSLPRNERADYEKILHSGMAEYLQCFNTQKLVSKKKKANVFRILKNWDWKTKYYDGGEIPTFFVQALKQGKLPSLCLDLIDHGFTIMGSQIECEESPPAFQSALGLLLGLSLIIRGDSSNDSVACFHMRHLGILSPRTYVLRSSAPLVGITLSQIETLSFEEKKTLLACIMNLKSVSWVEDLPNDLQLFILAVVYWSCFSTVQVTSSHSLSAVLCLVFVYLIEHRKGVVERDLAQLQKIRKRHSNRTSRLNFSDFSFEELISLTSTHECVVSKCALVKYLNLAENYGQFDRERVQIFSNLQAILLASDSLNVILGEVYTRPVFQHMLSGSIFYSICCAVDRLKDPWVDIDNMLKHAPNLLALLHRFADVVDAGVSACGSKARATKELCLQWAKDVSVTRIHGYQNQRIVREFGMEGLYPARLLEGLLRDLESK